MKKRIIACALLAAFCCGCATTAPARKKPAKIDYGKPLSVDYEKAVKKYCGKVIPNPSSAVYEFSYPEQSWIEDSSIFGRKLEGGYLIYVNINSKNKKGAYTGKKRWAFLFRNNSIVKVLNPDEMAIAKTE